uniref:Uncharacterized protein n=1 Tax=Arundo donax TaxID=35708 RepID=A0A0A9H896_ARUDO
MMIYFIVIYNQKCPGKQLQLHNCDNLIQRTSFHVHAQNEIYQLRM